MTPSPLSASSAEVMEAPSSAASSLGEVLDFLEEYTRRLLGSGVHTSRVIRNAMRIATSQGADLNIFVTVRCLIMTIRDLKTQQRLTRVVTVPVLPISFELNSDLSALSWDAFDDNLTLAEVRRRYEEIVERKHCPEWLVTLLLSLANGAFCRLFHGDWTAVIIVIIATAIGVTVKNSLLRMRVNLYFAVALASFAASLCASVSLLTDCTASVALATSPLFLVPGVPLINCVIDTLEGHILTAVSRLIRALLLVLCISFGLAWTLLTLSTDHLPL